MAHVLCLNAGSSSLRATLFADQEPIATAHLAEVEHQGDALHRALAELEEQEATALDRLDAVGHRVVHGGPRLERHAVIDAAVRAELDTAVPFAPLHLPAELGVIDAVTEAHPGVPQVACLDTAFHRTIPEAARRLPLPARFRDAGVRRYGFHGLSYEYVVDHVGADELGRAVVAHLGSGASLAAIAEGRSVDTTMGFTPAGGVVMATRPGDLDPGTVLYLLRQLDGDDDRLEDLLFHECGLRGLAGDNDMAALLDRQAADEPAALAVEVFCRTAAKAAAGLAVVLGGLDTLVFTGGIGEHAPEVRARIAALLAPLGVAVDGERNTAAAHPTGSPVISGDGAPVVVRVVATDENVMVARHTERLVDTAR